MNPSIKEAIEILQANAMPYTASAVRQMAEENEDYQRVIWAMYRQLRRICEPNNND